MSEHERDKLAECLSSRQGMKLRNIKFFRGTNDVISKEDFKNELCASIMRRRDSGLLTSGEPPRCKKAPIDVRTFVEHL